MSSSFSARTKAQDVIDTLQIPLHDKNVIITGASSGIGAECARVFVKAGMKYIYITSREIVIYIYMHIHRQHHYYSLNYNLYHHNHSSS